MTINHDQLKADAAGPWHIGAMNDGLFIIDKAPRPSNDDVWHDRPDGPSLVIPVSELSLQKARLIVEQHNAAYLAATARAELAERHRNEAETAFASADIVLQPMKSPHRFWPDLKSA